MAAESVDQAVNELGSHLRCPLRLDGDYRLIEQVGAEGLKLRAADPYIAGQVEVRDRYFGGRHPWSCARNVTAKVNLVSALGVPKVESIAHGPSTTFPLGVF